MIDKATVTLLFLPIPFFMIPLYHTQWVVTWDIMAIRNKTLPKIWNTAQLCHTSWLFQCPAICNPNPETADTINTTIKIQSITKILFIHFQFYFVANVATLLEMYDNNCKEMELNGDSLYAREKLGWYQDRKLYNVVELVEWRWDIPSTVLHISVVAYFWYETKTGVGRN